MATKRTFEQTTTTNTTKEVKLNTIQKIIKRLSVINRKKKTKSGHSIPVFPATYDEEPMPGILVDSSDEEYQFTLTYSGNDFGFQTLSFNLIKGEQKSLTRYNPHSKDTKRFREYEYEDIDAKCCAVALSAVNRSPKRISLVNAWLKTSETETVPLPYDVVFEPVPLPNTTLWEKLVESKTGDVIERGKDTLFWQDKLGQWAQYSSGLAECAVGCMANWTKTAASQLGVSDWPNFPPKFSEKDKLDILVVHKLVSPICATPCEGFTLDRFYPSFKWAQPFTSKVTQVIPNFYIGHSYEGSVNPGKYALGFATLVFVESKPL
jgi:hypothetical protein